MATLNISPETVCFILIKAREFDEKVEPDDPNPGSNPSDDKDVSVLEDYAEDPTLLELTGAFDALNEDEQDDLLALMWLGRGDFDSWEEATAAVADTRDKHISTYLLGTPILGDYLEEGLHRIGLSCEEYEIDRL